MPRNRRHLGKQPRRAVIVHGAIERAASVIRAAKPDMVNHPPHYTTGKIEVIDFIEDKQLGFHLGNSVKYIARSAFKGTELEDLKKARWYLDRQIANLTKAGA